MRGTIRSHLGGGQADGGPESEAVNRPSRRRRGGRALGELLQQLKTIGRLVEPAGRAQAFTIAGGNGFLKPGDFLADSRVGLGRPGRVRRALAVAVLGPAFQHGRGALFGRYARADRDNTHGESPRAKRGPQGRVGHAPRAQLAIGGQPRIDVHKRRCVLVRRDRKFQRKTSGLRLPGRAIFSVRQDGSVDAQRLKLLHLVRLGREPPKRWPSDEVIERQQPPHEDQRGGVLRASAVFHVLDAERPVDRLVRDVNGQRAAGKDGPIVFRRHATIRQDSDEATRPRAIRVGLKIKAVL